jgi:plasmid stability protein
MGDFDIMISEALQMAQILVRNVSEDVKVRLKRRAEARGVRLEAEVREILDKAANEPAPVELKGEGAGTKFARHLATLPSVDDETWKEFEANLAEVRGVRMRDVDFDK